MKTTVEIPDALLEEALAVARLDGTTLRALILEGVRTRVTESHRAAPFKLRDASVPGNGLQPGIETPDWSSIRDLTYLGRGR